MCFHCINIQYFVFFSPSLQAHLRPPLGYTDPAFKAIWDTSIREFETRLLSHQIEWVHSQKIHYQTATRQLKAALKDAMKDDPEGYKDAESAINTVACRVRTETLTAEKKKWSVAMDRLEQEQLGVNTKRQNRRSRPQREPQPGPSTTGRTFKQARRSQGKRGGTNQGAGPNNKAINNLLSLLLKK